jgi:hypothetical protein
MLHQICMYVFCVHVCNANICFYRTRRLYVLVIVATILLKIHNLNQYMKKRQHIVLR